MSSVLIVMDEVVRSVRFVLVVVIVPLERLKRDVPIVMEWETAVALVAEVME